MAQTEKTKKDVELYLSPIFNKGEQIDVNIFHLNSSQMADFKDDNIYSKSLLFILVLNGNATIEINFKKYDVESKNIILLSQGHFFKAHQYSDGFKCIALYIGTNYIEEMYSAEMLYKRTKYNVKMYNLPQVYLSDEELNILRNRFDLIEGEIRNVNHPYQKDLILSTIRIFFTELSNIIEQHSRYKDDNTKIPRDEVYFQKFLDILVNHYQREHQVDFYAQELHITPHYLTVIIKRLTGQTVSDLIFQLIFSEAKLLLQNPDINIQQIAEQLNFSDQSAFGKFFKRKSGVSPKEYRKTFV